MANTDLKALVKDYIRAAIVAYDSGKMSRELFVAHVSDAIATPDLIPELNRTLRNLNRI